MSAVTAAATRTRGGLARRAVAVAAWSRANPVTALGFVIILGLIATALLAPYIAPYGAYQLDPTNVLAPPSRTHFFGTGNFISTAAARCMANVTGHRIPSEWYTRRMNWRVSVFPTRFVTPRSGGCQ